MKLCTQEPPPQLLRWYLELGPLTPASKPPDEVSHISHNLFDTYQLSLQADPGVLAASLRAVQSKQHLKQISVFSPICAVCARVQLSKGSMASTLNLFKPLPPHRQKQEGRESLPMNTFFFAASSPHLMISISTPGGQHVPTGHVAACPPHSRNTNDLLSTSLHGKAPPFLRCTVRTPQGQGGVTSVECGQNLVHHEAYPQQIGH